MTLVVFTLLYFQCKEKYQHNSMLTIHIWLNLVNLVKYAKTKLNWVFVVTVNLNYCWISEGFWGDYFINIDPFTTFNCTSTNEDKAFEETLELPIVKPDLIYPCWGHAWIAISWSTVSLNRDPLILIWALNQRWAQMAFTILVISQCFWWWVLPSKCLYIICW